MQRSSSYKLTSFSPLIVDNLWNKTNNGTNECMTGIFTNFFYGWICKENLLHIYNLKDGSNRAFWRFGMVNKNAQTIITCVLEVKVRGEGMLLLVGTSNTLHSGGLIHLFNIQTCSVIKCVKIPFEVTALEIIGNINQDNSDFELHNLVADWSGVVALGTQCGHLYIMDLCLTNKSISSESSPASLILLNINYTNNFCQHHYFEIINSVGDQEYIFYYEETGKNLLTKINRSEVFISCLKFFGNASLLIIGYNFGTFQIWNMQYIILEFSSSYYETSNEITHISFQQPENDPKPICYFWTGVTSTIKDQTLAHIYLYQLLFKVRENNQSGYVYKDLLSCACRFSSLLSTDRSMDWRASKLISCTAVARPGRILTHSDISLTEESGVEVTSPEYSLCVIAWSQLDKGSTRYILSLFDLNQWYFSALPSTLNISLFENAFNANKYWILFDLNEEYTSVIPDSITSMHVDATSLRRFCSLPNRTNMQSHMEPSALNFCSYCLSESGIVTSQFLGIPQKMICELQLQPHSMLLNPSSAFSSCLQAGLLFDDLPRSLNSIEKREKILSLCLDYNSISLIISCIRNWSKNDHSKESCTMNDLNKWAFTFLKYIKFSMDDLSGELVVKKSKWSYYKSNIDALTSVYEEMLACSNHADENSVIDITYRLKTCKLLNLYLKLLELLHNVEAFSNEDVQSLTPLHFEYSLIKSETLMQNILNNEASVVKKLLTQNDAGNYYPPNSFQNMLQLFPIPDVEINIKIFICLYLLQDISHFIKCFNIQNLILELKKVFNISISVINFTLGIWMLDHKFLEKGLDELNKGKDVDLFTDRILLEVLKKTISRGSSILVLQIFLKSVCDQKRFTDYISVIKLLIKNNLINEAYKYCNLYNADPIPIIMAILLELYDQDTAINKCYQLFLQNKIDINKYPIFATKNPDLVLSHNLLKGNFLVNNRNVKNVLQFKNSRLKSIYKAIMDQFMGIPSINNRNYIFQTNVGDSKMEENVLIIPTNISSNEQELNIESIKHLFSKSSIKSNLLTSLNDTVSFLSNKKLISCLSTKTKKLTQHIYDENLSLDELSQSKLKPKNFRFSEENDYCSPPNLKKFKLNENLLLGDHIEEADNPVCQIEVHRNLETNNSMDEDEQNSILTDDAEKKRLH